MVWFFRGLAYPFRGLGFAFAHKDVLRWFVGPILLGIALVIGELAALSYAIHHWLAGASTWKIWLAWIGGAFTAVLVFLALQGTLSAPFNDTISKRTEALETGQKPADAGLAASLASFAHAFARAIVYLVVLAILFVVGLFVPFTWIASLLWTAAYAALDAFDYPTTRRRWSFGKKLGLLGTHTGASLGFGIAAAFLAGIPLVGLLVAPAAAVGGTLLFLDLEKTKR